MEYIKLCDICDFQGGSQPPKDEWSFEPRDGYIRMLQIRDFTQGERVTPEYIKITKTTKVCKADDILIARYGASLGKILTGLSGAYNVAIMRTIPNTKLLEKKYLYYYLKSSTFQTFLLNIGNRAAQAGFNKKDLEELRIPNISREAQCEIVSILERVEAIISTRQQQLQKLDDLVKARFVELFGDPISNSHALPEATLPELGEFGRGVSKHRPRNDPKLLGGKYPLIQTGDVASANLYITSYTTTYSELGLAQSKMWGKGTLCITIAANIAKTAILNFDACFPDSIVGFTANGRTNNIFIHYWFSFFQEILESQAPESAQKNINLKILSELKVIVPAKEKQDVFADFVTQTDKSKVAIQKALDEAQLLFDSLMEKYFQ